MRIQGTTHFASDQKDNYYFFDLYAKSSIYKTNYHENSRKELVQIRIISIYTHNWLECAFGGKSADGFAGSAHCSQQQLLLQMAFGFLSTASLSAEFILIFVLVLIPAPLSSASLSLLLFCAVPNCMSRYSDLGLVSTPMPSHAAPIYWLLLLFKSCRRGLAALACVLLKNGRKPPSPDRFLTGFFDKTP